MPRIFDASELTRQKNIRTIYTNVLGQQEAIRVGFTNHGAVVNGGTTSSELMQITSLGPIDTTPTQRDEAIAFANAQVVPRAAVAARAPRTSITARYIKFSVTALPSGSAENAAVAGFRVSLGGTPVTFNAGRSVRMVDNATNVALSDTASTPANFVNGYLTSSKAFPFLPSGTPSLAAPRSILIDNTTNITFDSYTWATADKVGGGTYSQRDPVRWKLETSTDGVTYEVVDDRTAADVAYTYPGANYTLITPDFVPSVIGT